MNIKSLFITVLTITASAQGMQRLNNAQNLGPQPNYMIMNSVPILKDLLERRNKLKKEGDAPYANTAASFGKTCCACVMVLCGSMDLCTNLCKAKIGIKSFQKYMYICAGLSEGLICPCCCLLDSADLCRDKLEKCKRKNITEKIAHQ